MRFLVCYTSAMWTIQRIESRGSYDVAIVPDHPAADSRGRVYLHRIVKENELGRLLTKSEVVHHKNERKKDNASENLGVFASQAVHAAHHARPRNIVEVRCALCGNNLVREKRNVRGERVFCSKSHSASFYALYLPQQRESVHGTYGSYRKGCRCTSCRNANATRIKRWRNRV
jgi:formylmethanofuran dehydrogenase subunit E